MLLKSYHMSFIKISNGVIRPKYFSKFFELENINKHKNTKFILLVFMRFLIFNG